jgi:hypothetical protein
MELLLRSFRKNLIEMMPEMVQVITHQVFERGRLVLWYGHERDFVEVMFRSRLRARAFWYRREYV